MVKSKPPSPIPYVLATVALLAGGYWWFYGQKPVSEMNQAASVLRSSKQVESNFPAPTSVAQGTTIRINGSTSMVSINQNLKQAFEQRFAGTQVQTRSIGSNAGLKELVSGQVDIAAISRPLTTKEQRQGLQAVTIASDPIALVVGVNNPFKGGLTSEQVKGIFTGTINDWSKVGGPVGTLQVINRPVVSGTYQAFKDLVLKNNGFGINANFTTLKQDATTPLLRAVGDRGISYATYSQVVNQKTVRSIAIDGKQPDDPGYPYNRSLSYVYKHPANTAVKAFLGYATSPQGQQAIFTEK